jgi:KaiC/GvpD/RAD55 family RecA-like ATPase
MAVERPTGMDVAAEGFLDVLDPGAVPDGTSVLVSGPSMTGKRALTLSLLAGRDTAEGTVLVTTRRGADEAAREYRDLLVDTSANRLAVVDCVTQSNGFSRRIDSDLVRYVSDPGDLTGIGIGVTTYMHRFDRAGNGGRVGLHSLSTMLLYADVRRVFQFLHVVTGRVASTGFVGAFAVDEAVPTKRELDILRQPFDATVETRATDGEVELRVRGGSFGPRSWTPVEP